LGHRLPYNILPALTIPSWKWHPVFTSLDFATVIFFFTEQSRQLCVQSQHGGPGLCIYVPQWQIGPITVATRSKAWTFFTPSNAGIVGPNPIQGTNVCVCVLWVGSGLATDWSPVQGVLPTVYRINKLKKRARSNKGL
jgi:hypothetical protein